MVPMESLTSPVTSDRDTQPQPHAVSGQDTHTAMSDQCVEVSPLHSDPEDTQLICSPPQIQDTGRPASAAFSPPSGPQIVLPGPENPLPQTASSQRLIEPLVQYQVSHQLQVSQALFAHNQGQIQSAVPKPLSQAQASVSRPQAQASISQPQVQAQLSVSQPQSSIHTSAHSSLSPLRVSVSVPQQQPNPTAASAVLSKAGDDSAVQQHTQNSELSAS